MPDDQETEVAPIPPIVKRKVTPRDKAIKNLNRVFIGLNVLALILVAYQMVQFFGVYSKKGTEMTSQGRLMQIDVKTGAIKMKDLTEDELNKMGHAAGEKKEAEAIVGPMPTKANASGAPKPLDYNTANLSIIVTHMGMKQTETELAKDLPKEVSFAFAPYADEVQKKIDAAVKDGHQVMLMLPMQATSFPIKDNGPYSIQINYDDTTNLARFNSVIALAKNYTGLLASYDEVVTGKIDKMTPIMQEMTKQKIFFGYYKTNNNVNLENDAKPLSTSIFGVDFLVDEDPGEENITRVLDQVKEDLVLRKKKLVIAIRPYPTSMAVLKKWLKDNLGTNVQIAPISYFVTKN